MSAVTGDTASRVSAQVAQRWQAIDPLLPAPGAPPGCGADLVVTGAATGAALVAELHRQLGAAGIAVALLHYEQTNPLAAPFWGRQRYRPLWTSWEARPARLR